jgi:hypothetical protein
MLLRVRQLNCFATSMCVLGRLECSRTVLIAWPGGLTVFTRGLRLFDMGRDPQM